MDKQQQVRDFLENTIKEKGLSLNALSLKLGKNSTYLFHFIKRHSPRRLDETTRHKLAEILNVSEQELCDFPLQANLIQDKLATLTNLFGLAKNKSDEMVAVDVFDMDGTNKGRFEHIKKNALGEIVMAKNLFTIYTSANTIPENIKIIKICGDAMAPTLNSGDFIWVDTSFTAMNSDGIYLLNTAGDVLIRRLQINPFDNSIEVNADNKSYRSFNIADCKNLNICGKIIMVTKKNF